MSPTTYTYDTLEPVMSKVYEIISRSAQSSSTVLIEGPSGSGKEALCRLIHQKGFNPNEPYSAINCSAIPEHLMESELFGYEEGSFTGAEGLRQGRFEMAGNGTIVLDEISEMNLKTQAKLLRVLETKEFYRIGGQTPIKLKARILVTTNKNLSSLAHDNLFREDLFHRLNVVRISIPALSERTRDIPLLVDHFLDELKNEVGRKLTLSPEVYHFLCLRTWEGNIRELKNFITRIAYMTTRDLITVHDLGSEALGFEQSSEIFAITGHAVPLDEIEKKYILHTLHRVQGNKSKAARALKISLKTLRTKLKEYEYAGHGTLFMLRSADLIKDKHTGS